MTTHLQNTKTVIIFDHLYGPCASESEQHNRSFSAAVFKKVKDTIEVKGGEIDLIDLRADNFNPVMSKEDLVAWRIQPFGDKQTDNYFQRLLIADKNSIIGNKYHHNNSHVLVFTQPLQTSVSYRSNRLSFILATTIVDLETFVSQSHCNFAASK